MRQFANYIHIAPAFRVVSVANNTMVMKGDFTPDKFSTLNEVEPSFESTPKPAGMVYNTKVSVAVNKLTSTQRNFYANNAPVIVALLDVETVDRVILGTPQTPATVTLIPGTTHDQLVIEYTSKTPVL